MKQMYHSAYGVPLSGVDHEFMRFLELRRAIPTGRATHEPSRLRRLGLAVGIPIALMGCAPEAQQVDANEEAQRGLLRAKLNQYCLQNLPAGPQSTRYNDWDEVVEACSSEAYYQANGCEDPELCLRELFPAQGTSAGTAKTEGLGAKPAGPVTK